MKNVAEKPKTTGFPHLPAALAVGLKFLKQCNARHPHSDEHGCVWCEGALMGRSVHHPFELTASNKDNNNQKNKGLPFTVFQLMRPVTMIRCQCHFPMRREAQALVNFSGSRIQHNCILHSKEGVTQGDPLP